MEEILGLMEAANSRKREKTSFSGQDSALNNTYVAK
jgi:hypothetical protein